MKEFLAKDAVSGEATQHAVAGRRADLPAIDAVRNSELLRYFECHARTLPMGPFLLSSRAFRRSEKSSTSTVTIEKHTRPDAESSPAISMMGWAMCFDDSK